MTADEYLDRILVPRPNGSEALETVAGFLEETLRGQGADVASHFFTATPLGFQLCFATALLLMLGWSVALVSGRYRIAAALVLLAPALLLVEFELLWSTVSWLYNIEERNVIGVFPGHYKAPVVIFTAHYDTTTHFGDHRDWGVWGWRMGPAIGLAVGVTLVGTLRKKGAPAWLRWGAALAAPIPFAAMFWFHGLGPLLREPSPGAIDNGGSVVALLRLGDRLSARPVGEGATVRIVFVAAEEERALGSQAYAETLLADPPLGIFNLESIGANGWLAWVPEDGFELRRFRSPRVLVDQVNAAAAQLGRKPLPMLELPPGTLTDGRSFLARGLPALTLLATEDGSFPTRLHSEHDSRDRLSVESIEETVDLLEAIVELSGGR